MFLRWLRPSCLVAVAVACLAAADFVAVRRLVATRREGSDRGAPTLILNTPVPLTSPDRRDCGAVSLYVICRRAGVGKSIAELRELTRTGQNGATMLDLRNAATAVGLEVQPVKTTFEELSQHMSAPGSYAILHSLPSHFVSALGVAGERIILFDPKRGVEAADASLTASSRYAWDGNALLIRVGASH